MSERERDFGSRLKELREASGVSQRELGSAIELDQSAVHRMEAGERKIEVGEMIAACEYLGVPVDELLQPQTSAMALRASGSARDLTEVKREFRKVIDDFFAFRAAAGR